MFLVAGVGCVRIYSSGIKVRRVKLQMRFLFSSSAALMKFEQVSADALREGAAIRQKNMEAVEGRNRRALGDIGNLFTGHGIEGKQQQIPQVSRTVTSRILCSQLLFNLQKQRVVGHQKKVTVKPRPEDIIIISPDTKEVDRENKHLNRKKATEGSLKKKGQTFTLTLTARSKAAAFGLTRKPKEHR
ncbi:hypothetical protein AgCh_004879 [Apium graveolens]